MLQSVPLVLIGGFIVCATGAILTEVSQNQSHRSRISANIGVAFLVAFSIALVGTVQFDDAKLRLTEYRTRNKTALADPSEITTDETRTLPVDHQRAELPDWTGNPQTVISSSQVENVLLVEQSASCATESEAIKEATAGAVRRLRDRIAADWPEMETWIIPDNLFTEYSFRKQFVESQTHEFAGFQEPMYRAYIQFEDSATVREPVIDHWQTAVQHDRATDYAVSLGAIGIGLGIISAVLRGLLAFAGRPGKTVSA